MAETKNTRIFYNEVGNPNNRASVGGGSARGDSLSVARRISQEFDRRKEIFVERPPINTEGQDGDRVLYENRNNYNIIEQYLKVRGQWINITTGRPITDSAKVKRWIKGKTD